MSQQFDDDDCHQQVSLPHKRSPNRVIATSCTSWGFKPVVFCTDRLHNRHICTLETIGLITTNDIWFAGVSFCSLLTSASQTRTHHTQDVNYHVLSQLCRCASCSSKSRHQEVSVDTNFTCTCRGFRFFLVAFYSSSIPSCGREWNP